MRRLRGAPDELVAREESLQPAHPACCQQERESPREAASVSGSAHQCGETSTLQSNMAVAEICAEAMEGWRGRGVIEEGERGLRQRLIRKKKGVQRHGGSSESRSAVMAIRFRLKLQHSGLKEAIKLLFPPLIYGGGHALLQSSAARKEYGFASIRVNWSSGPVCHSCLILTNNLFYLIS